MKKMYLGSVRLQNHFRMVRVKYNHPQEMETIKSGVMELMSGYLQNYGGKLINVVDLQNCRELLVYFVTGKEGAQPNWDSYIRNTLLKDYTIIPGSIELGPRPS